MSAESLKQTLGEHITKQQNFILQAKSVLYDLARQEEDARRRRRVGEQELAAMQARLDLMRSSVAELDKGETPQQTPEPLAPSKEDGQDPHPLEPSSPSDQGQETAPSGANSGDTGSGE